MLGCSPPSCAGAPAPDRAALSRPRRRGTGHTSRFAARHSRSRAERDSAFPGAYAVVGTHAGILAEDSVGHLDWGPSAVPDEHSLWDLASLTKVVGMTTGDHAALRAGQDRSRCAAAALHPRVARTAQGARHDSASDHAHVRACRRSSRTISRRTIPTAWRSSCSRRRSIRLPGVRMVYSDIGAYMLGRLVERLSGETLDQYVLNHVFRPLGMNETMYRPPASLKAAHRADGDRSDSRREGLGCRPRRAGVLPRRRVGACGHLQLGPRPCAFRSDVPE